RHEATEPRRHEARTKNTKNTKNVVLRTKNQEPRTKNQEPKNQEPRSKNSDPSTENREPRTENLERRTPNAERRTPNPVWSADDCRDTIQTVDADVPAVLRLGRVVRDHGHVARLDAAFLGRADRPGRRHDGRRRDHLAVLR